MSLVVAADAAVLGGVTTPDITTQIIAVVDATINSWMNRPYGFEAVQAGKTSYYDIKAPTAELALEDWPITVMTSLTVNAQATSPRLLSTDAYTTDFVSGVVTLKSVAPAIVNDNWVPVFPRGLRSVKAVYTYGYAAAPTAIIQLANILAGKFAKSTVNDAATPAGGITETQIGDFRQKFGTTPTQIESTLNTFEKALLDGCIRDYKVVV